MLPSEVRAFPKMSSWSAAIRARHIALPSDHGSWIFLFSPLLIGLVTGGIRWDSLPLIVAVLAGFLIRQPVTVAVRVYAGRRPKREMAAILFWIVVYSLIGLAAVIALGASGNGFLIWLVLPASLVFAWYLWLVRRRAERRQLWVELVASGVLALAAPAAYWVGKGYISNTGWLIWGLTWMQIAGTILYAYLRLNQRVLKQTLTWRESFAMARPAFFYHLTAVLLMVILAYEHIVPRLLPLAYVIQLLEVLWGMAHPAVGVKPKLIGFRQLVISLIFTVCFILIWGG